MYSKPEITALASASFAIQASLLKPVSEADTIQSFTVSAAYEADE